MLPTGHCRLDWCAQLCSQSCLQSLHLVQAGLRASKLYGNSIICVHAIVYIRG